jgi:hypothetical protein
MFMGFDGFYLVIEAWVIYLPAAPLLGFEVPRLRANGTGEAPCMIVYHQLLRWKIVQGPSCSADRLLVEDDDTKYKSRVSPPCCLSTTNSKKQRAEQRGGADQIGLRIDSIPTEMATNKCNQNPHVGSHHSLCG